MTVLVRDKAEKIWMRRKRRRRDEERRESGRGSRVCNGRRRDRKREEERKRERKRKEEREIAQGTAGGCFKTLNINTRGG